jgi:hypothetical protein
VPTWAYEIAMPPRRPSLKIHCVKTFRYALIVAATGATAAASQPLVSDPAANFVTKLFIEVCVPNMGQPGKVREWANQKHLPLISSADALREFVGEGSKGGAWFVPSQSGNFALSIRGTTEACAVWALQANPSQVETLFQKTIDGVRRPGLEIAVVQDKRVPTSFGETHALVYSIRPTNTSNGFVFSLLTSEKPNGAFQVSMQISRASLK